MPPITCHILDTARGKPASGVVVALFRLGDIPTSDELLIDEQVQPFAIAKTNEDGRVPQWVHSPSNDLESIGITGQDWHTLVPGVYRARFQTAKYFQKQETRTFFPFVDVLFTVADPPDNHYHIPLLLAQHSYTTYRGS